MRTSSQKRQTKSPFLSHERMPRPNLHLQPVPVLPHDKPVPGDPLAPVPTLLPQNNPFAGMYDDDAKMCQAPAGTRPGPSGPPRPEENPNPLPHKH